MQKFSLSLSLSLSLLLIFSVFSITFTACGGGGGGGSDGILEDRVVTIADIPDVIVPVRGETPVTTEIDTAQYTGTIVWDPAHNSFGATTIYTANIDLTEKDGFTFEGVAENFFKVAGATSVTNPANSGVVTAVFPATGAESDIDVVFLNAVQTGGVSGTADSTGLTLTFDADPVTLTADNITVTGATKGTLSGTGTTRALAISNITVADGEEVTVTIGNVSGYALTGSPKKAVVYKAPSSVTISSIPGVIPSSYGETPVTSVTETAQYTGAVSWSPSDSTFAASTVYTATITLTAKSGYTFTGVGANFFTVAGATSVTNSADSGVVTAVFPKTFSSISIGDMETYSADGVSFKMAYVPGGFTFPTGTGDSGTATVDNAYLIGDTQVTYELWKKVYDWATTDNGNGKRVDGGELYQFANDGRKGSVSGGAGMTDQHPVTCINWRDSMVWCNALTEWYNTHKGTNYDCVYYVDSGYTTPLRAVNSSSTITHTTPGSQDMPYIKAGTSGNTDINSCTAKGFRLLTGNEWELAARYRGSNTVNVVTGVVAGVDFDEMEIKWTKGNSASGDTQAYNAASPTVGNYAVYTANSGSKTAVVKTKNANALGLYDMSGNVWEWNFDSSGSDRVFLGGSWNNNANGMQVGYWNLNYPRYEYSDIGFRFARSQ